MMGYDPTTQVAFLVYRTTPPAANVTSDELSIRGTISNSVGAISAPITQPFPTTWDGHPAMQVFYQQAGSEDVMGRANALANALIGAGAGVLSTPAAASGPFKL